MRSRAALVLVILAALSLAGGASAAGGTTRLAIDVWPHGRQNARGHRHYTLRCHPATGTVPRPAAACALLDRLESPFAPTPAGTVCPMINLGPAEAHVVGLVSGRRVDAWLNLVHCGPQRWNRVKAIVPEPALTVAPPTP